MEEPDAEEGSADGDGNEFPSSEVVSVLVTPYQAENSGRTMLVASAGGHLDELIIMSNLLDVPTENAVWVTSKNAHTESILEGKEVVWLPRVGSGETTKALRAFPRALELHRRIRPNLLVSTGALFAVPHLLAARMFGCETWFVDSATRIHGPSATGRFAQRATRSKLMMQRPGWADPQWTAVPNVFDTFEAIPAPKPAPSLRKVVVSLGSELWPFERAVSSVLRLLPDAEVAWQTGTTAYMSRGDWLRQWVPAEKLRDEMLNADVVITHAGVGSLLASLECGKVPVILPRRAAKGEHVDDHQLEFAELIGRTGLAVASFPEDLTVEQLAGAAALTARRRPKDETTS